MLQLARPKGSKGEEGNLGRYTFGVYLLALACSVDNARRRIRAGMLISFSFESRPRILRKPVDRTVVVQG